jgi:hypothetical protein
MSHVGFKGEWMMKRVTSNFLPAIAALVALLVAGWSQAAVITLTYVNGQVSTTSNFTTATTTSVNLAQKVLMSPNQFFRFGVAVSINNPNPEFGTEYATDANAAYGVNYPQHLGFVTLGMTVGSDDAAGAFLAPLNNSGKTRVAVNNTPWPGATTDAGDVQGGIAGQPSSIFRGLSPAFTPDATASVSALGTLGQPGANFINSLPYLLSAVPAGDITLFPTIKLSDTSVWTRTAAGVSSGGAIESEANFGARVLNLSGGDSIILPAAFGGGIVVTVPEPASIGLIGLSLVGLLARRRTA